MQVVVELLESDGRRVQQMIRFDTDSAAEAAQAAFNVVRTEDEALIDRAFVFAEEPLVFRPQRLPIYRAVPVD